MKKFFSIPFIFILLIALFVPNYAMAASQYESTNLYTNFSQQVTVDYGAWMTGANSTFDVLLSDLLDTTVLANGYYPGWCIEPEITGDLHSEPATIYSSVNETLPVDLGGLPWGKVNYLLNHKIRGDGQSDYEFFSDVSDAIQVLVGKRDATWVSPESKQMIAEADANSGFIPMYGDTVAFIVYTDGLENNESNYYQEVIIEVLMAPPTTQTPTETPSPTDTPSVTLTSTETMTATPQPTETVTATPSPTESATGTPSPTETATGTPAPTITTTPTVTPPVCVPTVITADFSNIPVGQSVEGMGVVAPGLNIDARGTAVRIQEGVQPAAYGASNENPVLNGGLASTGGFSDISSKTTSQAHQYTFTFAPGTSVTEFSLHMLDYGDYNPSGTSDHYASMTAYDFNDVIVSKVELSYTTDANMISAQYGNLRITGDAVTGLPGQPGNWTWQVSGSGIVRVVLDFGAGYDPYLGFDILSFTADICQLCAVPVEAVFSQVPLGQSVEGMGVVVPELNIDAKGTAVRIQEGAQPVAYGASNENPVLNGALASNGGFSDISTKTARQAHQYTFTFTPGTSVTEFSLRMLDYGDYNPSGDSDHYASMTAYDVNDTVVSKVELSYTTDANMISAQYGNLRVTGDAVTGLPGQPGNWTWQVSGSGIVRVVLDFGAGYDPYLGFDILSFVSECP